MDLTPSTLMKFFGFAWLVLGLMWIRRAYIGERRGVLVTLRPSLDRTMSRRERIMALFSGVAFLLMAIVELVFARR